MGLVNKQPYITPEMVVQADGVLTQDTSTTEYTILSEVTFRKSRWIRKGNVIQLSCFFKCNTSSTSWKSLARNLPLSTAILDYNVHGTVYDFVTGKVATNAGMLLQSGTLYVQGGTANTDYFIDILYLAD